MRTVNSVAYQATRFSILSESQIEDIQLAALEVLRRTGIRFHYVGAVDMVKKAGAFVSTGNLVKIPARMVEDAINSSPARVIMCDRDGEPAMSLEGTKASFGTGSDCLNFLDHATGKYRKFTQADIIDGYRLCDALPNIDFQMSIGLLADVDPQLICDVQMVSFENMPSFIYRSDRALEVPEVGDIVVDVFFGGLFFILVDTSQLEIELTPEHAARLADLGMRIVAAANQRVPVRHPELPHIDKIIDLRFYEEPVSDGVASRNVVILGDYMVDRSPCGTGTCAEVALRYARGQLVLNEPFVTESIIGTRFSGQAIAETQVSSGSEVFPAVIPKATGSAHITGFHQFVLDPEDPFLERFRLIA